ncbi:MAG: carbohydrate kinase [Bacteroidetes bacterium]|nr:carbohydrate kinase [Bacteroidota bacterium]
MESRRTKKYDILACGELLIDFISSDFADNLDEVSAFKRLQGGSPANLSMNMARLGNQVALAATVGNDDMGHFLERSVSSLGVHTHCLRKSDAPTTLILVTRSREVSNFEAYRGADLDIQPGQISRALLGDVSILHTTCFALSKQPARDTILEAAALAKNDGATLSIDANYAHKIWPEQEEARNVVESFVADGGLVKISEVDFERLYGRPLENAETVIDHFLEKGASLVCVTLGGDGCWLGDQNGHLFLPARKVEVKDTTGAGDAFWSGFLTAWLDGGDKNFCGRAGRRMAELKLGQFGPLPHRVDRDNLYKTAE